MRSQGWEGTGGENAELDTSERTKWGEERWGKGAHDVLFPVVFVLSLVQVKLCGLKTLLIHRGRMGQDQLSAL